MFNSISKYLIPIAIAMLPFLGYSGDEKESNEQEPPQQELQMDVKKGNGLVPMNTRGTCDYCPPIC